MKWYLMSLVLLCLAAGWITGCVAQAPIPTTYQGVALPGGGGQIREDAPPPAWLIVGNEAVPATVAAFTAEGVIADPPYAIPDLPSATLPAVSVREK